MAVFNCLCGEQNKPIAQRNWVVVLRKRHCSVMYHLQGHEKDSRYSTVLCRTCGERGRTDADFVAQLADEHLQRDACTELERVRAHLEQEAARRLPLFALAQAVLSGNYTAGVQDVILLERCQCVTEFEETYRTWEQNTTTSEPG